MMTINNSLIQNQKSPLGLYLHIPFCMEKCNYCDFLSFSGLQKEQQSEYIKALMKEIEYYGKKCHNKYYVDSIFVGGGTPSIMEAALIADLIAAVRANFLVVQHAEITLEANPKTLTEHKLKAYLEMGINRLSIGAQSLNDELLKTMGRIHKSKDFIDNYQLARACGFTNINIDLMFSIPGQTVEDWMDTLQKAMNLKPEHISFYGLQLEEETPFYKMYEEGKLELAADHVDRQMYHLAVEFFHNHGYHHYEISNSAIEGNECRHNLKYWSMEDYLGLGLGAHSYLEGMRFSNLKDFNAYIKAEAENKCIGPYVNWNHLNSRKDDISEYIFTGMRKLEGIDLKDFERRYQMPIEEFYSANWHRIKGFIDDGYLVKSDIMMRFTIEGIDISNIILAEFV